MLPPEGVETKNCILGPRHPGLNYEVKTVNIWHFYFVELENLGIL